MNGLIKIAIILGLVSSASAQVIRQIDTDGSDIQGSGNSGTTDYALSSDAKYAFFLTTSTNINGDTSGSGFHYYILKNLTDESVVVLGEGLWASYRDNGSFSADNTILAYIKSSSSTYKDYAYYYDIQNGTETQLVDSASTPIELGGGVGNGEAIQLSADGNYAVFSTETALVANDLNLQRDFYLHDRVNNTIDLVVTDTNGEAPGFNYSDKVILAKDGSTAILVTSNEYILAGHPATSGSYEYYVIDIPTKAVTSAFAPVYQSYHLMSVSDDGKLVLTNEQTSYQNYVLYDTASGSEIALIPSTANWSNARLSGDGRYVFFTTYDALVVEDVNGGNDVYVYEIASGNYGLVSITNGGTQISSVFQFASPSPVRIEDITSNGQYIMFATSSGNFFDTSDTGSHVFLASNPLYKVITTLTEPTDPNTGDVTVTITGGDCNFNNNQTLTIESGSAYPQTGDYKLIHGVVGYTASECSIGSTMTVQIEFPSIPNGAEIFKLSMSAAAEERMADIATNFSMSGNIITYDITDGGTLDEDGIANGVITDPVGVGVLKGTVAGTTKAIPAVGLYGLLTLVFLSLGFTLHYRRHK